MSVFNDLSVLLDTPEQRITVQPYNQRFRFKDHFAKSTSSKDATGMPEVWLEPASGTVMLRPVYDTTAETTLAATTRSGGSWVEADAVFSGGVTNCRALHQYDGTAGQTTVQPNTTWAENQSFYFDLYAFGTSDASWYGILYFGEVYALLFNKHGNAILATCHRPEEAFSTWDNIAEGRLTSAGQSLLNRPLRLAVYCVRTKTIVIASSEVEEGLVSKNPEALQTHDPADHEPGTILYGTAPKLLISGGQYVTAFRPMKFAASGSLLLPTTTMFSQSSLYGGEGGTSNLKFGDCGYLNYGGETALTLVDKEGVAFEDGAEKTPYRVKAELTAGPSQLSSPQVLYADVELDLVTETEQTVEQEVVAKVQRFSERRSLEDGTRELTLHFVPGQLTEQRWLLNRRGKLLVGSEGAATLRSQFYTGDPNYKVDASTGYLEYAKAKTRVERLKQVMISDVKCWDGKKHTEAVEWALKYCGLSAADYNLTADTRTLPQSTEDEDPLYRYKDGTTAYEMIRHIIETFSGWRLYERGGIIQYAPAPTSYEVTGLPVFGTNSQDFALNRRITEWSWEIDTSQFYNQIWVIGEDDSNGDLLVEFWQDVDSMWRPTSMPTGPATNLGYKSLLIQIDPALNTQAAAERYLRFLRDRHGKPRLVATMKAWYDETIYEGDVVAVQAGTGLDTITPWEVQELSSEVGEGAAWTTYTLLYKGDWTTVPRGS